jgi:malate dehydrogenase (oxaloacetate-decarboxylating)(NADP+)
MRPQWRERNDLTSTVQFAFRLGKGEQVRHYILHKAQSSVPQKRIVFAEGEEPKILRAAAQIVDEKIGLPLLIGHPEIISRELERLGLECCAEIVDPANFARVEEYAQAYYEIRQRKGLTLQDALRLVRQPNILGPMMVKMGDADAFVSGLTHDYPDVIRPALQIHQLARRCAAAAGLYIVVDDRTYHRCHCKY